LCSFISNALSDEVTVEPLLSSKPADGGYTEELLEVKYAETIFDFEKKLKEGAEYPCCSCERLHLTKNVSMFKYHNKNFDSDIWCDPKTYLLHVACKDLYVCQHCCPLLNSYKMPACSKLNPIETQLIQRAKCFQTVVRLVTYTGKVPIYNALKAAKGIIFPTIAEYPRQVRKSWLYICI